jgi:hypothetical protein
MRVRFRVPWDKELFFEGEVVWRHHSKDWCSVRVPGQYCLISLPFSKVKVL